MPCNAAQDEQEAEPKRLRRHLQRDVPIVEPERTSAGNRKVSGVAGSAQHVAQVTRDVSRLTHRCHKVHRDASEPVAMTDLINPSPVIFGRKDVPVRKVRRLETNAECMYEVRLYTYLNAALLQARVAAADDEREPIDDLEVFEVQPPPPR